MGEIKTSLINTTKSVTGAIVNKVGSKLPPRINKLLIAAAWSLGFGRGAVAGSVVDGVQKGAQGINTGMKDVIGGISTATGGIKIASRETIAAARDIFQTALKVSGARRAAQEVTETSGAIVGST